MSEIVEGTPDENPALSLNHLKPVEQHRILDNAANRMIPNPVQNPDNVKDSLLHLFASGFIENLVDSPSKSLFIVNPETDAIFAVNNSACRNYLYTKEELLSMPFTNLWQDGKEARNFLELLDAKEIIENFESVHLNADGTTISVKISTLQFGAQSGEINLSLVQISTAQAWIEQRILLAKKEWSDTVDAISDLIMLEGSDGNLRRCNRATAEFFQQSFPDLIGKPLNSLIQVETSAVSTISDKEPIHLRQPVWQGQFAGHRNWYEITNHRLPPAAQTGWVHIVKNITDRKHAEAELQMLYTAIEQAADAILITDFDGSIQYVNSSFEKMQGWSRSELIGRPIFDIKTNFQVDENFDEFFSALLVNGSCQRNYKSIRKDGEVYEEEATISLARREDGTPLHCVFVCRDVTETRRLESIAEAVNMMNNVGYIFSGIRHELGNPINSIKTALTVLKQSLERWDTAQIEIYIERCLTETARVEYLLRTLKTFSMYDNVQRQVLSVVVYMKNFIALIEEDFRQSGIEIILTGDLAIEKALFDPRALHQIMLNLLANSADALSEQKNRRITINLQQIKNQIYITIADNGAGMSESQKANLFKPFYTSKPKGNGLGLVIVKSMLGKMNGTIVIESTQNIGTKAIFTLETESVEADL